MTDILRASITAKDCQELKDLVMIFENIPGVKIIKYKPKFYDVE